MLLQEHTFFVELCQPLLFCKEICQLRLIMQPIKTTTLDISQNYVLEVLLKSILSKIKLYY